MASQPDGKKREFVNITPPIFLFLTVQQTGVFGLSSGVNLYSTCSGIVATQVGCRLLFVGSGVILSSIFLASFVAPAIIKLILFKRYLLLKSGGSILSIDLIENRPNAHLALYVAVFDVPHRGILIFLFPVTDVRRLRRHLLLFGKLAATS